MLFSFVRPLLSFTICMMQLVYYNRLHSTHRSLASANPDNYSRSVWSPNCRPNRTASPMSLCIWSPDSQDRWPADRKCLRKIPCVVLVCHTLLLACWNHCAVVGDAWSDLQWPQILVRNPYSKTWKWRFMTYHKHKSVLPLCSNRFLAHIDTRRSRRRATGWCSIALPICTF